MLVGRAFSKRAGKRYTEWLCSIHMFLAFTFAADFFGTGFAEGRRAPDSWDVGLSFQSPAVALFDLPGVACPEATVVPSGFLIFESPSSVFPPTVERGERDQVQPQRLLQLHPTARGQSSAAELSGSTSLRLLVFAHPYLRPASAVCPESSMLPSYSQFQSP